MEPISVAGALSAASQISTLLKGLIGTVKESGKTEVISKVIDLQTAMMELLQKHHELIDENQRLQSEIHLMSEQLKISGELTCEYGAYWRRLESKKLEGPFSMGMWDADKILYRMELVNKDATDNAGLEPFRVFVYVCRSRDESAYIPVQFLKDNQVLSASEIRDYKL